MTVKKLVARDSIGDGMEDRETRPLLVEFVHHHTESILDRQHSWPGRGVSEGRLSSEGQQLVRRRCIGRQATRKNFSCSLCQLV